LAAQLALEEPLHGEERKLRGCKKEKGREGGEKKGKKKKREERKGG